MFWLMHDSQVIRDEKSRRCSEKPDRQSSAITLLERVMAG
jgi:hypothetical protein